MRLLFISQLIHGDIQTCQYWLLAIAIMGLVIVVATLIDLRYARMASKMVGIFKTTSHGLRKTVYKTKDYLAFLGFAVMMDGCLSVFTDLPYCAALVTAGVIFIEATSVREKINAINKGHDPLMAAKAIANAYGITDFQKLEVIIKEINKQDKQDEGTGTDTEAENAE